jgi:hypothetical protein
MRRSVIRSICFGSLFYLGRGFSFTDDLHIFTLVFFLLQWGMIWGLQFRLVYMDNWDGKVLAGLGIRQTKQS